MTAGEINEAYALSLVRDDWENGNAIFIWSAMECGSYEIIILGLESPWSLWKSTRTRRKCGNNCYGNRKWVNSVNLQCGFLWEQFGAVSVVPPLQPPRNAVLWKHLTLLPHDRYRLLQLCSAAWRHKNKRGLKLPLEMLPLRNCNVFVSGARRPRRHSDMRLHEVHPKARKRTHSEPPNIKKCAPPAPRMVP